MQSLFFGKAFYEALEDDSTRVRFGVNRMADAVDQTGVVECVLVEQACEVTADFFIVFPVVYFFFHFLEHPDNLDICAAVARLLGANCRCDNRIGIGQEEVTTLVVKDELLPPAMLHMQDQRDIEDFCFQRGVTAVRAQDM